MNNNLIPQKRWFNRNWKWLVWLCGILLITIALFFTSNMDTIVTHLAQAYANTELYENALEKAKANNSVTNLLGDIQPIDKLAILEGQVEYSNDNKTINSSIRIVGTKGKGNLDVSAKQIDSLWKYTKINVRIKNPPEKKQTIKIVPSD